LPIALDVFGNHRQGCGNSFVHGCQSDASEVESGPLRARHRLYRGQLCTR
jgi:hypothetical protein